MNKFRKLTIITVLLAVAIPAFAFAAEETDLENAFTRVAETVGPAVVTIKIEKSSKVALLGQRQVNSQEDQSEEFFRNFFGAVPQMEFKQQGMASGVIIDKEGHVLTNQHVIEGATKIKVILPDGRSFEGFVQGEDRRRDIAVLKIEATDIPYAELGDSDTLKTGQWAIAIGNPFGNVVKSPQPTVTVGVISALHRSIPLAGQSVERYYMNLIQTDAAINIGNSGGPLCDLSGEVIGINVAIFSTTGGNIGMGFAIPINTAKKILGDLINGKKVVYGWLGIGLQEMSQEIVDYFHLPAHEGVLVAQVIDGSPAEKGGLKPGDIIKTYNGEKVADVRDVVERINYAKVGDDVVLGIMRDGKDVQIEAIVGEQAGESGQVQKPKASRQKEAAKEVSLEMWRGIKVSSVTNELAARLNLTDKSGVVIIEMVLNSATYAVGLRPGDVIKEINHIPIENASAYKDTIKSVKGSALLRTNKGYYIVKE